MLYSFGMKLSHLQNFSTSRVKTLLGFHPQILAEILTRLLPELSVVGRWHWIGVRTGSVGSWKMMAARGPFCRFTRR